MGTDMQQALFACALRLGDTSLVLGHRLSEWCGHAPELEEDIALTNVALDLVGHARLLLSLAGELEGQGRDEDRLAYRRDVFDYRNHLLVEQPNRDFGHTVVRQFLHDSWAVELYERLASSTDSALAGIAAKAVKEVRYHVRHSGDWLIRLGDGTAVSHAKVADALGRLWPYTGEMFERDAADVRFQQTVEAFMAGQNRRRLQEEMLGDLQYRLDLAFDPGFAGHVVGSFQQVRDELDVGGDKTGHDNVAITVSQGDGRMQVRQLFFQLLGKLASAGFVLMGTGNLLAQCGGVHESSSEAGVGKGRR